MYNPQLHFHFTGIGGSGMSGLAEILLNLGFKVSGSDLKRTPVTDRLVKLGAVIGTEGHSADNLPEKASLLVFSSAVDDSNPEIQAARARGLPIVRRAEVLAELMRLKFGVAVAGSHGKTTTTSMTAHILEEAGLDPTAIIGGQVRNFGSGGKLGKSQYLVAESDESDRSFLLLKPTIAIVTNIDAEHLGSYSSFDDLERSFAQFVSAVPFYGLAVLCADDAKVRSLAATCGKRVMTYGFSPDARLRAVAIQTSRSGTAFDVLLDGEFVMHVSLPMIGRHLAQNALAAIAVALEFGIAAPIIVSSLASFQGVKRRLEVTGDFHGVPIISDYGHHPTEVRATIAGIKEAWSTELRQLHVVFQPHRYSRTRDCFADFLSAFAQADTLLMTEIYAAGEKPIDGISAATLSQAMPSPGTRAICTLDEAPSLLASRVGPGDVILCLGAGSIGAFAERLPALLLASELQSEAPEAVPT